eukprot:TRINITY_DN32397_c0_g1_i2.p1 TRINITY_DN32397_c0_g1~~TRINITY_DN32397_c0_g1_i2.p1  ORF type:complete len:217 (+),score=48.52 TRINITY_DN32397_c0_g1_i2:66-716(+)
MEQLKAAYMKDETPPPFVFDGSSYSSEVSALIEEEMKLSGGRLQDPGHLPLRETDQDAHCAAECDRGSKSKDIEVLDRWRNEARQNFHRQEAAKVTTPSHIPPEGYSIEDWRRDQGTRLKKDDDAFLDEGRVRRQLEAYEAFLSQVEADCDRRHPLEGDAAPPESVAAGLSASKALSDEELLRLAVAGKDAGSPGFWNIHPRYLGETVGPASMDTS